MQAMGAAASIDIDQAEAILRVELGSSVSELSSKELKTVICHFLMANNNKFINCSCLGYLFRFSLSKLGNCPNGTSDYYVTRDS